MKYRLSELEVSSENPFQNDTLERKPLVEFLVSLIGRLSGPFVLALDSPWGTGKTTLIKMLQAELMKQDFQCLYFNAWQVDYVADPLVALVSAIDEIRLSGGKTETKFRSHMKTARKITTAVAKRGVVAAVKAATLGGLELDKEFEAIVAEGAGGFAGDIVETFQKEKESLRKLRNEIEKAIEQVKAAGKKQSLIFFIDELDRCRPTFSIEMLERIKHLFDVPNIVFVLSVDKSQLEASTAAVYGERINAPEYLRRFIDLEYGIPVVQSKRFTQTLLTRFEMDSVFAERTGSEASYDKDNFIDFFTTLAEVFRLSLRTRERCITCLAVVMDQTPSNHYLDPILVALLIVLRLQNLSLFHGLCEGTASAADAMGYLSTLPGGAKLVASRSGAILEAYLLAGDPDEERKEAVYKDWVNKAKSITTSPEHLRAVELLDTRSHIPGGNRHRFRLKLIAGKIDLAASVQE